MISARTLERLGGWNTKTISEDLEITAQCVLAGEKIYWVPKAVTYDEQPLDYAQSVKQRRRWTSGTIQVARGYLGQTGRATACQRRLSLLDLGATLLIPIYQVAALANLAVLALSACLGCYKVSQVPAALFGELALNLAMTVLGATLAACLVLTVEGKWDRRMGKSVALYWLFLLSWLPITLGSFFKDTTVWEEIRHTRNTVPKAFARSRALMQ